MKSSSLRCYTNERANFSPLVEQITSTTLNTSFSSVAESSWNIKYTGIARVPTLLNILYIFTVRYIYVVATARIDKQQNREHKHYDSSSEIYCEISKQLYPI